MDKRHSNEPNINFHFTSMNNVPIFIWNISPLASFPPGSWVILSLQKVSQWNKWEMIPMKKLMALRRIFAFLGLSCDGLLLCWCKHGPKKHIFHQASDKLNSEMVIRLSLFNPPATLKLVEKLCLKTPHRNITRVSFPPEHHSGGYPLLECTLMVVGRMCCNPIFNE